MRDEFGSRTHSLYVHALMARGLSKRDALRRYAAMAHNDFRDDTDKLDRHLRRVGQENWR